MHLYKTMKNFLFDQNYFVDLWDKYIHIYLFVDILTLNDKLVHLQMDGFQIEITGEDFRVLKLTKKEILITGFFKEMRFL